MPPFYSTPPDASSSSLESRSKSSERSCPPISCVTGSGSSSPASPVSFATVQKKVCSLSCKCNSRGRLMGGLRSTHSCRVSIETSLNWRRLSSSEQRSSAQAAKMSFLGLGCLRPQWLCCKEALWHAGMHIRLVDDA